MKTVRHSIRLTWLLSYLALLAVPVAISIVVYASTARAMEDQLNDSSATLVDLIGKDVNGRLEYVNRLLSDIMWDSRTQGLIYRTDFTDSQVRFDLFKLADNMAAYQGYGRNIDSVFVYFRQADRILVPGASYDLPDFHRSTFAESGLAIGEMRKLLSDHHANDCRSVRYSLSTGQPRQGILILKSLPNWTTEPVTVTIGVLLDRQTIIDGLHSVTGTGHADIKILNSQGETLVSTFEGSSGAPGPNERDFTVLSQRTRLFDWSVKLMVPNSVIKDRLYFTQVAAILGCLTSLALGGFLTFYLLRRNYRPVSALLASIPDSDRRENDSAADEYGFIHSAVTRAYGRLEQSKEQLRRNLVSSLLRGRQDEGLSLDDRLASLDLDLAAETYQVLLVQVSPAGASPKEGPIGDLAGWLRERLPPTVTAHPGADLDTLDFLLCLKPAGDQELAKVLTEMTADFRIRLDVRLNCALSKLVRTLGELPLARGQALAALEYGYVTGSDRPSLFSDMDVRANSRLYRYSLEDEERLINTLRAGESAQALESLREIIRSNRAEGEETWNPHAARGLIWELCGTIMKTLNQSSDDDPPPAELLERIILLSQGQRVEQALEGLATVVPEACAWVTEQGRRRQLAYRSQANRELIEGICDELRTGYADPGLNLSRLADRHGLSPAYLSRLFRENREEGLLDFLNRLRIERAKQLLRSTDQPLQSIAAQIGFTDVGTFIRSFRKLAGVTPGKYRESQS